MAQGAWRGGIGLETRIALALCVTLGCALCGKAASDAVRRRAQVLAAMAEDLRALRIHMTGMLEPVRRALERSGNGIFTLVAQRMEDGRSAHEAWLSVRELVARRGGPGDALAEADLRTLDGLFEKLGQSGRDEQERLLETALQTVEALLVGARKRAGETDRLYVSLGLLIGLMLALVVI